MGCTTAAPLRDDPLREQLLRFVADAKYEEAQALPCGLVSGRRLQLGNHDLSKEQLKLVITEQYLDIGRRLGTEFLRNTPAVALEQFAIMAINRDQDTAGLLKSLIALRGRPRTSSAGKDSAGREAVLYSKLYR